MLKKRCRPWCNLMLQIYKFWGKKSKIYIQTSFVKHVLSLDHFEFTSLNYSKIIKYLAIWHLRILPSVLDLLKVLDKRVNPLLSKEIKF